MKKILAALGALSILVSSSTVIVACSANKQPDDSDWQNPLDDVIYELFGEQFTSKEDAIDYYLLNPESGVKINKHQDVYNELLIGEKKLKNFDEVFNYINSNYEIKETTTNKDVDSYIMDSLGQLYPEVVRDSYDETYVYKDANGRAVSESNEQLAKQAVNKSYTDKIEEFYYVQGKTFENKHDVEEYYHSKFLNNNEIPSQPLYSYGNLAYSKEDLELKIENSIVAEYTTKNGDKFLDSQVNDLNVIKLREDDKSKISKVQKSPGLYYVEQMAEKDGVYTGDSIIESNNDIQNLILNKNNWELVSQETSSAKEVLYNYIGSVISTIMSPLQFIYNSDVTSQFDKEKIDAIFHDNRQLTIDSIFKGFGVKHLTNDFIKLINLYGLAAHSNAATNSLKNIEGMDFSTVSSIYLYQMREAFRYSNISKNDNLKLNQIYYDFFMKFDDNKEWEKFVKQIGVEDANHIADFLVNRGQFTKYNNSRKDKSLINTFIEDFGEKSIEFAEEYQKDIMEKVVQKVKNNSEKFKKYSKKILKLVEKAQKALIITSIVMDILDFIPVSSTKTYQLRIPDTNQVLEYQMTNFIFSSKTFNPEKLFRVTELKKPMEVEMYLYQGRYFPTYDFAVLQLKRDIIEETLRTGEKIYYSVNNSNFENKSKDKLIQDLLEYYIKNNLIKNSRYTDFFGGEFNNQQDALNSMLDKLEKEEYQKFYRYSFGTNEYHHFETYEKAKVEVLKQIKYEKKKVSFSKLIEGENDYDKLYDLDLSETKICYFNFNGINYYFKDKTNAIYYIMKLLNFKNHLIEIEVEQYSIHGKFFANKFLFIDYLYSNIKEIKFTDKEGLHSWNQKYY